MPTSRWCSTSARRCRAHPRSSSCAVKRTALWAARARACHAARRPGAVRHRPGRHRRRAAAGERRARRPPSTSTATASVACRSARPAPRCSPALAAALESLPADRPRYLMGVGDPASMVEAIALGVDQFDCVLQTRLGRHGTALTSAGKVQVKAARHGDEDVPVDARCACAVCARHSRGYLRHLFNVAEPSAARLLTLHNVAWTLQLMAGRRRGDRRAALRQLPRRRAACVGVTIGNLSSAPGPAGSDRNTTPPCTCTCPCPTDSPPTPSWFVADAATAAVESSDEGDSDDDGASTRLDDRRVPAAPAHRRGGVLPAAAPAAAPDAPAARAAVEPRGRRRGHADVGRLRLHHRLRDGQRRRLGRDRRRRADPGQPRRRSRARSTPRRPRAPRPRARRRLPGPERRAARGRRAGAAGTSRAAQRSRARRRSPPTPPSGDGTTDEPAAE